MMQLIRGHLAFFALLSVLCRWSESSSRMYKLRPNWRPRAPVVIPRANISKYCQNIFVNFLCEKPAEVKTEKQGCINCSIHDFYHQFCGPNFDSRFPKSNHRGHTEHLNRDNYCESYKYNFKENALRYLGKSTDFQVQCQNEINALCPSMKRRYFSRKQKEMLFSHSRMLFAKKIMFKPRYRPETRPQAAPTLGDRKNMYLGRRGV